jgi:hypothetical protein
VKCQLSVETAISFFSSVAVAVVIERFAEVRRCLTFVDRN